jgi:hypothetical protein
LVAECPFSRQIAHCQYLVALDGHKQRVMFRPLHICALAGLAAAGPAAADLCVTCTGPAATYDCTVKKAEKINALAGDKAVSKVCTTVLRKRGQHAACEIVSGVCTGTQTTIGWKDVKAALAAGLDDAAPAAVKPAKPQAASPTPAPASTQPQQAPSDARPAVQKSDTAVASGPNEAASRPGEVPPEAAEPSLGDKLKSGAEKSWKCVATLFGEC